MSNLMEKNREDNVLIDRYLCGDQEAFGELVKKYQNYVINVAYSVSGDSHYAEDIAQEVFIRVYRNLGSFEKKATFSTWLYRISVNTTYSYLKVKKGHVPLEYAQEITDLRRNSLAQLESEEKQHIIKKAIENLPFKYRTVLVLKDIEGLSYADIAQTLNCRIGTVESRLFRARAMLKKKLTPLLE